MPTPEVTNISKHSQMDVKSPERLSVTRMLFTRMLSRFRTQHLYATSVHNILWQGKHTSVFGIVKFIKTDTYLYTK